jgi:hypothetical protein
MKDWMNTLQETPLSKAIAQSAWLFPTIETIHVLAIVLVVGSILWVDLRLLNIADKHRGFVQLSARLLPITWSSFGLAALAGALLFISKASAYYANTPFRLKLICILLAGANMLIFNLFGAAHVADWDSGRPPARARVAGGISLCLWVTVVALGRWIGFTT